MGFGEKFYVEVAARSMETAFDKAVKEAREEHGDGGNTGTIAEKDSFIEIKMPKGYDHQVFAENLLKDDRPDPRIYGTVAPAGCIHLGRTRWFFFGRARN